MSENPKFPAAALGPDAMQKQAIPNQPCKARDKRGMERAMWIGVICGKRLFHPSFAGYLDILLPLS